MGNNQTQEPTEAELAEVRRLLSLKGGFLTCASFLHALWPYLYDVDTRKWIRSYVTEKYGPEVFDELVIISKFSSTVESAGVDLYKLKSKNFVSYEILSSPLFYRRLKAAMDIESP